jgi:hypothetical protein
VEEHYTEPMSLGQLVSVTLAAVLIALGGLIIANELRPSPSDTPHIGSAAPLPTLMPTPPITLPPPAPTAPPAVYVENYGGNVTINQTNVDVDVTVCISLRCD